MEFARVECGAAKALHAMSQYIAILKFTNKAEALADVIATMSARTGKDINGADVKDWMADRAMRIQVWRASQDTTTTVTGPGGQQITVPVHNYLSGYYVLISLNRLVLALRDHAALQLVIDLDKLNARQAGGIIRSTVGAAVLQDIRFAPTYLGMNVPWGSLT